MSKKKSSGPTIKETDWIKFQLSALDKQVTNLFGEFRGFRQIAADIDRLSKHVGTLETRLRAVEAGSPVTVTAASTPSATVEFKPAAPKFDPKLPWRIIWRTEDMGGPLLYDNTDMKPLGEFGEQYRAAIEFVVRAVNAHADAVELAKMVLQHGEDDGCEQCRDVARRVLESER